MIAAALAMFAYTLSVCFTFRELMRPGQPREGRIMFAVASMIALAAVCGGVMTDATP